MKQGKEIKCYGQMPTQHQFTAVHYMLNYIMFILLYSRLQQFVHNKHSIVIPINMLTAILLPVYLATVIFFTSPSFFNLSEK